MINVDRSCRHFIFGELIATSLTFYIGGCTSIFNVAKRWGYLDKNPFNEIGKLKVEERRLYLTDSELRRFFGAISLQISEAVKSKTRERLTLLAQYFEFLLNTGLRREEALNLEPSDVNLEQNVVFVKKAKDKEARVVPLTDQARRIIDSIGGDLFSGLTKSYVSHGFKEAADKAGLKGMKLHSLRHTFATRMIDLGVDVLTVSKILGHSNVQTTMIYAKVRLDTMRNALKMLDNDALPVRNWYIKGVEKVS